MRVYLALYKWNEDEYGVECETEDEPSKEEIQSTIESLEDALPEGGYWINPPNESNYFLK